MRRWVGGVLAQADEDIAATTLAVLWNASALGGGPAAGRHFASAPLSSLLHEPFAALGSTAPELDAALAAHATLGLLSDCLWQQVQPTRAEVERVTAFCLGGTPDLLGPRPPPDRFRRPRPPPRRTPRGPSSARASP